jgi:TIR domain
LKRTAFISHSSKDKAIAETVCRFLEAKGISCWIAPRDVTPGKNYGAAIVEAIDECKVFVLILSGESNQSGQVVREVERAANANSVIIPLRVEPVQPSRDLEFYVSSSHWLDATDMPLEKHLGALVDAIRNWHTPSTPQEKSAASEISSPVVTAAPKIAIDPDRNGACNRNCTGRGRRFFRHSIFAEERISSTSCNQFEFGNKSCCLSATVRCADNIAIGTGGNRFA